MGHFKHQPFVSHQILRSFKPLSRIYALAIWQELVSLFPRLPFAFEPTPLLLSLDCSFDVFLGVAGVACVLDMVASHLQHDRVFNLSRLGQVGPVDCFISTNSRFNPT